MSVARLCPAGDCREIAGSPSECSGGSPVTGFEPGERKRNLPFAVGMFAPACFSFAAVLAAFQVIAIRAFQLNFRYAIWCGVIAIALFCLYRLISVRKLIHDPDAAGRIWLDWRCA